MGGALGFTVWELLWTLAVAGAVLGMGVPAFTTFVLDSRLTADVNAWVLAVQVARSEAAKRGRTVIACASDDQRSCGGQRGFMVFVDLDGVYPPTRSAGEPLVFAHTAVMDGTIASNRPFYEFRRFKRSTNGTTTFCDRRGAGAARAVIVSFTGRPRVSPVDASGRPVACAAP